tara:strand:- start:194 stop:403 length:210 start_codon:yes stop_codon:yes gene_type:complete
MEPVDETGIKETRYGTTTTLNKKAAVSSLAKGVHNICGVKSARFTCWAVNDIARVLLLRLALVDKNGCG